MAKQYFDCRKCTNEAYSKKYDAYYCLPHISSGESPIEYHDMGGLKKGDYFTCSEFTEEPRPLAIYEMVSVFSADYPCHPLSDAGE